MENLTRRRRKFDIIIGPFHVCRFVGRVAVVLIAGVAPVGAQGLDTILDKLVQDEIDRQVASQVETQIEGQVESAVEDQIDRQIESGISEHVEAGAEQTIAIDVNVDTDLEAGLDLSLGELIESLTAETRDAAQFVPAVDADNRATEANVWVILVPTQYEERIETWGFELLERRDLESLDRVLLRVEAPGDRDIAQAALDLALDAPGTVVDYNHVYDPSAEGADPEAAFRSPAGTAANAGPDGPTFSIGIVDSIVDPTHPALAGLEIEQQDFVPFGNERVVEHGTAVASVIVDGGVTESPDALGLGKLWAASVFFEDDGGNTRATTASLIAALDWLASAPGVRVINMSLAGPANKPLEVALEELAARGIEIVAAVGNNGPTGGPLYPAAYDSVIGVTAVDARHRVYRYANRGRQVMFSALGVQVRVASSSGGFVIQSGTSFAAPLVAAVLAQCMAREAWSGVEALEHLTATAIDLGDPDYDEIYGYGLLGRTR